MRSDLPPFSADNREGLEYFVGQYPSPKDSMKTLILFLMGVVLGCTQTTEQIKSRRDTEAFRITLSVDSSDESKSRIESYIRRELRSLGDVTLVETNSSVAIRLVGIDLKSRADRPQGYAISVVVAAPFPARAYLGMPMFACLTEHDRKNVEEGLRKYELPEFHSLFVCGQDELKTSCDHIVAAVDSSVLEPQRKLNDTFRQLNNAIREQLRKTN